MPRPLALVPLVLLSILSLAAAPAPAPDSDFAPAAFEKLPPDQKVAEVIDALRRRDKQLQNFSYALTFNVKNVPIRKDEPLDPKYQHKFEPRPYTLQRLGEQYLFTAEEHGRRGRSRWDGSVYRSLVTEIASGKMRGHLSQPEPPYLTQVEFNHLFGFRSFGIEKVSRGNIDNLPATLPQVLDHYVQKGHPMRVRVVKDAERSLVQLHVLPSERDHVIFWFDPSRDWLPVKYHRRHVPGTHGNDFDGYEKTEAVNLNTHEIAEAQEVGGLWVPKRTLTYYRLRTTNDNNVETIRDYTVTSFTRGDVKPADLLVPFGPGVEVLDSIAEVSYVLKEGGKAEPRPLFVPALGMARTASDADLAAALAANPPGDIPDPGAAPRKAALQKLADAREARLRTADPLRGRPAPAFPAGAAWVNSEPLKWDDLKGKVVILEFFADWCAPCRNDLPFAQHLHQTGGRRNIVVIGVHTAGSDRAAVDKFIEEMKLTFPILIDTPAAQGDGANLAAARAAAGEPPADPNAKPGEKPAGFGATCESFGVRGIPHSVVIAPDGKVAGRGTIHDAYELAMSLQENDATRSRTP